MFEGHPLQERLRRWTRELPGSRWFVVGGAVRDALLARPITDIDVLVGGVEPVALTRFLEGEGTLDFVGKTFGVFKFIPREGGTSIDIALPRTERPDGTGGYRDVVAHADPHLPLETDLERRDFTVNAMAWSAEDDRLLDPLAGEVDLRARVIRAVGDPHARFQEDYTRLLRALRFAAQLGFEIEPVTWTALRERMPRIDDLRDGQRLVPHELIARELLKGFFADATRTARLWRDSGALDVLIPELTDWPERLAAATARFAQDDVLRILDGRDVPPAVAFAASLAHLGPERAEALAERLRLASAGCGVDAALLRRISAGDVPLYKELGAEPLLSGQDVMRLLDIAPGPDVGRALDDLIEAQAKGMIAGPSEAEAWLKSRGNPS